MKRLLFGVLLVLTFVAAPLLRSQIKTKSLIITQTSTNIAMKGDTIRFAWSDSTQGAEYEVSVAYDGKGEFTPLATRLSKSSFNWKIPDSAGKNAVFQIVRSVEGARIDSVTSEKPLTIAEKDEKPLQGIDAVRSRDTSGSNRGFGINIGASFDLIDGLKNSSLFSELRFTEPLLIGHEKLGDKTMICPLFSGIVGGSLALRQSRTHYPSAISTLTVTHGEAITDGVTPTQSAQLKFDRSIEMNVTTLEFSVFLPFIRKTIDVDSSRFWSPSQKTEILLAVTCEVELFDKSLTASYEPRPTVAQSEQSLNQGGTRMDTVTYKGVAFQEYFHSEFASRWGVGVTLFLESQSLSYQLQYLQSGGWQGTYGFISSSVYLKKLGGISVGLRYWGYRGPSIPNPTSDRPSWIGKPPDFWPKDEFEFYLVKYFSLEKIVDLFKI